VSFQSFKRLLVVAICCLLLVSGCALREGLGRKWAEYKAKTNRDLFAATLSVAVASNMRKAFEELSFEFTQATGVRFRATFGPSDSLTSQIERGAPFDIFLSSDTSSPARLFAEHLATYPPQIYGQELLILWGSDSVKISLNLELLLSPSIHHIAIPDPASEACGGPAVRMLRRMKLYDSLKPKIVFAPTIAEVNRRIRSREVEVGISTFSSTRRPIEDQVYMLADWQYDPIPQAGVILRRGAEDHAEETDSFMDFLQSPFGRDILEQHGFRRSSEN
jgi:molybdate transport system substrate-binding protein